MRKYLLILIIFGSYCLVFGQDAQSLLDKAIDARKSGDKNDAIRYFTRAAYDFWSSNNYQNAIKAFENALELSEEIQNPNGIATINGNIGLIYAEMGNFAQAKSYLNRELDLRKKMNDKKGQLGALVNLATIESNQGNTQKAIDMFQKALPLAKEYNNIPQLRNIYLNLAEGFEKLGNNEEAFKNFELYRSLDTHLREEEMSRIEKESQEKVTEAQSKSQQIASEKKKTESALKQSEEARKEIEEQNEQLRLEQELRDKALQEKEARLAAERKLIKLFAIGLSLLGLLAIFLIRGIFVERKTRNKLKSQNHKIQEAFKEIQEQKVEIIFQRDRVKANSLKLRKAMDEIKNKNTKITSSINYAKRIQQALLPDLQQIKKYIPEIFVFFRPRDLVSGDFYWFMELDENRYIITAVDCTGHGVPGAFMSMLGVEFFNTIVNLKKIHRADLILNELHKDVRAALKQQESENRDGMDLALVLVDKKRQIMEFAGAKNPLVYIQNNEVFSIKGDKSPIGGSQLEEERIFTLNEVDISIPTKVFLFSDGFQDQFGGENGKKYMIKNLRQLYLDIHSHPFDVQEKKLEEEFTNWKGQGYKQVDDVLVIGFKP